MRRAQCRRAILADSSDEDHCRRRRLLRRSPAAVQWLGALLIGWSTDVIFEVLRRALAKWPPA